jgi:glycosyltransferase involved in cell wall biosynthesis
MDAALRPNEDAALEILRRSDVVVLPYLSLDRLTIDVPLLLLEAMATGCVVVSTPVGDIPAILDDPMLVGRPGELYARLDQLISPRGPLCRAGDLRARGARLRQRALDLGVNVESVADTFLERLSGPINP